MFTQPKNCCFRTDVRTGTMVLAVLQILSGVGNICFASIFGQPLANSQLYIGLLMIPAGIFGYYAVHKDSVNNVKHYKTIYWILFLLQFISWGILYVITLVSAANSYDCYFNRSGNSGYEVSIYLNGIQQCGQNIVYMVSFFFILPVVYLVSLILNLHFCSSIQTYYQNLLKAQAADNTENNNIQSFHA